MTAQTIESLLPESRTYASALTNEDIKALPNVAAVYLLQDVGGTAILLASTSQLRRIVLSRLAAPVEEAARPRADLAQITRRIRWREVHSRFEADWDYYLAAKTLHPAEYRKRVSFGPASFLHVDWHARVPELRLTDRIWRQSGEFIGPFPNRSAAQQALEGLWDLFDLCRYPEQVRQTPHGQHCAYAEMGRCDAPCDGTSPLEPMLARTRAAWCFAGGEIDEWLATAEKRMQAAAVELRFELAAQVKQQIEFARRWQKHWSAVIRRENELECMVVLPVLRRRAQKPFLFRHGELIAGPVCKQRSAVSEITGWLRASLPHKSSLIDDQTRMEQTWLLANLLSRPACDGATLIWSPADVSDEEIARRLSPPPKPEE